MCRTAYLEHASIFWVRYSRFSSWSFFVDVFFFFLFFVCLFVYFVFTFISVLLASFMQLPYSNTHTSSDFFYVFVWVLCFGVCSFLKASETKSQVCLRLWSFPLFFFLFLFFQQANGLLQLAQSVPCTYSKFGNCSCGWTSYRLRVSIDVSPGYLEKSKLKSNFL